MFAKLFDTKLGQILVKIDTGDDHPAEVRFFFEPEGLGVCSLAIGFTGNGEDSKAWGDAEKAFEKVTKESAIDTVEKVIGHLV